MADRLTQLLKLHEAEPDDPFLTYGIAMEHIKSGQAEAALQWLDRTLALDRTYAYAYFQKGKLLAEAGQTAEANAVLQQGVAAAREAGDHHAVGELQALMDEVEG